MTDFTLLHGAAWRGQTQLCIFLLSLGYKHRPGYGKLTPLQFATMQGHFETCKALIEHVDMEHLERRPDGRNALDDAVENNRLDIVLLMFDLFHVNEEVHARLLERAARRGYTACIQILLRFGSVNGTAETVPLLEAAMYGQINTCCQLMLHGADMTARNLVRRNALHCAAMKGHFTTIRTLLQTQLRDHINDTDSSCYTPLHYAAQEGHESVVELLISSGAKINVQAYGGETPLNFCITQRHQKVFDTLMKYHPKQTMDFFGNTPLCLAIRAQNTAMCEALLHQQPVHATPELDKLLIQAVDKQNLTVCKLLVTQMIPKTIRHLKTHAVARAVFYGFVEGYVYLRSAGIKLRNKHEDLMMLAVQSDSIEMCETLMKDGYKLYTEPRSIVSDALPPFASTHSETMTLLQAAAVRKRSRVAEWLARTQGKDALLLNEKGGSALHYAARNNDIKTYNALVKYVPYTVDNDGNTPLHIAVREGYMESVQTICNYLKTAEINLANQQNHTPFSLALALNHSNVVQFFLAHTRIHRVNMAMADVIHQNITKNYIRQLPSHREARLIILPLLFANQTKWFSKPTPLSDLSSCLVDAAARDQTDAIHFLLDHGVPYSANQNGETPLCEAAAKNYIDTCRMLLDYGIRDDGRKKQKSALLAAVQYRNFDVVRLLLDDPHTRLDNIRGMNPLRAAIQEEAPDDIIIRIFQKCRRTLVSELRWFLNKHRQTHKRGSSRLAWDQYAVRAAQLCIQLELENTSEDMCQVTDDRRCPLLYSRIQFPVRGRSPHIMEAAALVVHVDRHGNDPFTREPLDLHEIVEVQWPTCGKRPRN